MPAQKTKKKARGDRPNTDAEVGVRRTAITDRRHIAYLTGDVWDVLHLTPKARKQMGFDPFPRA